MTKFVDLPNEILWYLWAFFDAPEDLRNFAQVSRQVYFSAGHYLREHRRLAELSGTVRRQVELEIALALDNLILNPRVSLYVEELVVEWWTTEWQEVGYEDDDYPHRRYPDARMDRFLDAVMTSDLVPLNLKDYWARQIEEGDEDPVLALVFCRLPKLKKLRIEDKSPITDWCFPSIFRRIADRPGVGTLSMLAEVTLHSPGAPLLDHGEAWLNMIYGLSGLPSIKTIEGYSIECCDARNYPRTPVKSNLSHFMLHESHVALRWLRGFLNSTKALKTFLYTHPTEEVEGKFEPYSIREAVVRATQHSLETLTLMSNEGEGDYMGSLSTFQALKEVNTDAHLLAGLRVIPGRSPLVDALPPSIERVCLRYFDAVDLEETREIINRLAQYKGDKLPNFNYLQIDFITKADSVNIEMWDTRELKVICRKVGVELELCGKL